jgi:hypothetical protein
VKNKQHSSCRDEVVSPFGKIRRDFGKLYEKFGRLCEELQRQGPEQMIIQEMEEFLVRRNAREAAILEKLLAEDPGLGVRAYILAANIYSAELMAERVKDGRRAEELVWQVESFARLDWATKYCSQQFVLANLPKLWTSSDPDDTRPEYAALWRRAFKHNSCKMIDDGKELTKSEFYMAYRGQQNGDPVGLS